MSTPTPTHPPQPSSASKKTASHVTTPSHLGLSPAPRSVPSPAATRKDQAGKTPVNHPTVSSQGSKTLGSTPMMQNLSQTGFTVASSSPGTQMVAGGGGSSSGINLGTPLAGLGVDLGGIAGIGSSSSAAAGAGGSSSGTPGIGTAALMAASVSELGRELGLTVGGGGSGGQHAGGPGGAARGAGAGGKRNEDEERRAKMRRVLRRIGRPKGRVSEEGIARVSRRVGLANDIDAEKLTPEEKERKVGNRTIVIAGKTILVDVELRNHVAQNVQVLFNGSGKGLEEQGASAGRVLLRDLQAVDGVSLRTKLDCFAENLDWLARTDRLSDRVNCFEAISGLYTSLRRLYELEKEATKGILPSGAMHKDRRAETTVMCKRSGRPTIHENGKMGLSLDYWCVNECSPGDDVSTAMQVDGQQPGDVPNSRPDLFSLRIEVEASPAALHPALRVSDYWLPETFDLPDPASGDSLPWQDPPPTYLSTDMAAGQGDGMVIDDNQKLPDLRFVAKLNPPVVLPLQVAVNISNALGITMSQNFPMEHYHSMLLSIPPAAAPLSTISLVAEQSVLSIEDGKEAEHSHKYTLDVSKPDWGYRLEEVPFSHPRQLIELMPVLRQWAHVGALAQQAFKSTSSSTRTHVGTENGNATSSDSAPAKSIARLTLDDILGNSPNSSPRKTLPIDLTLSTSPQPAISLTFPPAADSNLDNVSVHFLLNGEISIPAQEDAKQMEDGATDIDVAIAKARVESDETRQMAKALNVCGDLAIWIEWLRGRKS